LALDSAVTTGAAADSLIGLARGNPAPLDRALRLLRARGAEPPSGLASRAADALGLALERAVEHAAHVGAPTELQGAEHRPPRRSSYGAVEQMTSS
jgi:hypothetical protein